MTGVWTASPGNRIKVVGKGKGKKMDIPASCLCGHGWQDLKWPTTAWDWPDLCDTDLSIQALAKTYDALTVNPLWSGLCWHFILYALFPIHHIHILNIQGKLSGIEDTISVHFVATISREWNSTPHSKQWLGVRLAYHLHKIAGRSYIYRYQIGHKARMHPWPIPRCGTI